MTQENNTSAENLQPIREILDFHGTELSQNLWTVAQCLQESETFSLMQQHERVDIILTLSQCNQIIDTLVFSEDME